VIGGSPDGILGKGFTKKTLSSDGKQAKKLSADGPYALIHTCYFACAGLGALGNSMHSSHLLVQGLVH
jgi:hypothetical protein